jgi:hypothetical protein
MIERNPLVLSQHCDRGFASHHSSRLYHWDTRYWLYLGRKGRKGSSHEGGSPDDFF